MHVLHYLFGIFYYIAVPFVISIGSMDHVLGTTTEISYPRVILGSSLFIFGSLRQYIVHSSIPDEYRLPPILFAHYSSEVLIYVGLWIITLPHHGIISWCTSPMFFVLVWVVVCLGVSARNQATWYAEKYGVKKVASRPWLYGSLK
jgi:uncharacterized membrane protein SirB2